MRRRRRDVEGRAGYRFAVASALVREHRMPGDHATQLVRRWGVLVSSRQRDGKSASSTAEHVERFERQGLRPPTRGSRESARDPSSQKREIMKQISKDQKAQARAKIQTLTARLRELRGTRKERLAEAKSWCREHRERVRERIRRARARLQQAAQRARTSARTACGARVADAQGLVRAVSGELAAERRFQKDMRRIAAQNRARRPSVRKTSAERRSESDDEVRQNIPPELVPLFNRIRRSIKGSARISRTEAFLQYAEENPGEVLEGIEDKTDALIREMERRQRYG